MLLRALGQLSLRARDGREVDAILKRPKALGVFLYLTVAEPRSFHRRDKLLALFWPDLDDQRGRHALRQTCYTLRRALPKTVVGRGSEELCVAPPRLWCDVMALETAYAERRFADVCELHGGVFADGLHIAGAAAEFDYWLSSERERLSRMALDASCNLADEAVMAGDAERASRWTAYSMELSPFDEVVLQRRVRILNHFGDRAGALMAYDAFATRLRQEFGVDPSPESQLLVARIRARRVGEANDDASRNDRPVWHRAQPQSGVQPTPAAISSVNGRTG